MTKFAICGPVRHAAYVLERLRRQGVGDDDIRLVLTRSDLGNNARTEVALADEALNLTWTEDSRALLAAHVPGGDALTGRSPTPTHAIFNMFYQNSTVANEVSDNDIIGRMRSDMVLYDDCITRMKAGAYGLAWNPIAGDSHHISDQFMAFPRDAYARIWDTDGFADCFTTGEGIPESMIRQRADAVLGAEGRTFAFARFVDFDIVYENARWADSPRMFWIKKRFGWQACYAATGRKGALTRAFDRLHARTVGQDSLVRKAMNLLLKIAYLPVFAAEMTAIGRALDTFGNSRNEGHAT